MTIIYNDQLKQELLKEMERISKQFRPDGLHWIWPEAERYHKYMYDTLSSMVHFPTEMVENE